MDVVNIINQILFERNMSAAELARLSGLSSKTVRNMLNKKSSPSLRTLEKIANALNYNLKVSFEMEIDE